MVAKPFSICVAIAVLAAYGGTHVGAQGSSIDRERGAIEAMYKTRLSSIVGAADPARAADAYVRDLADDAVWMPPNMPAVRGKPAVLAWAREFFRQYELQIGEQKIDPIEIGGTVAIRRFTSTGRYVPRDGGPAVPFDQKYVDVLRRASDGTWKLSAHMWSSNDPGPTIWK
jgi:ketosteroid isomerase-like protein